ncbi:S24 family peptidase [Sphingomonas sp. KC8]|uniref:S24 family peptidase n=1 Tax=Sphingomonas sp. KC8 TaxID=1030157 RepID=UPI000A31CD12|nr:helix-turn-helix domain-containing protein [Sphingomonas sp. KC8]ARS29055.1 repressor [Sphingomonas sp. KC8]
MERIREAIRRAMSRKDIKAKPLARAAGLGETAVRDILDPTSADIKFSTLNKLADALECSLEDLMGVDEVPLAGRIGAGGTIIFEDTRSDQTVMRPPNIGGKLEALEVSGDSMLPKFSDGDVIYIQRLHDGVLPAYIGEYCAVRLVTGETYLKLLAKGSRPGRFTLRSLNAADIEDVEVEWATPVVFILPRFARNRLSVI